MRACRRPRRNSPSQPSVRRSFVEDAEGHRLADRIGSLGKTLLVMHEPLDTVVGIDNASRIFLAAKHPRASSRSMMPIICCLMRTQQHMRRV